MEEEISGQRSRAAATRRQPAGRGGPQPRPRQRGREDLREPEGRFRRRKRVCSFCVEGVKGIDYKQAEALRRYLSDRGKILPRRRTGTCARHQRQLATAIKRARYLALLPFTVDVRRRD